MHLAEGLQEVPAANGRPAPSGAFSTRIDSIRPAANRRSEKDALSEDTSSAPSNQKVTLRLSPQAEKYARRDAPIEARKMAARVQTATGATDPILLRHHVKAGHAGGQPVSQLVEEMVDLLAFLRWRLGA